MRLWPRIRPVSRLRLREGDALVLHTVQAMTVEEVVRCATALGEAFPGHKVIVLPEPMRLSTVARPAPAIQGGAKTWSL